MATKEDPFRRFDYRRFVAWKGRIERELPFLEETFGRPRLPLLDVGCGTGEHADTLAGKGHEVVGLDRSAAMLEKAKAAFSRPRFVRGEMARLPFREVALFGGAYCLGNTLVNLLEDEDLLAFFRSLRALLVPGAPFLVQIVNYRRILEKEIRHLPLSFRKTEEGEVLFLRLLDPIDDRRIRFEMLTIRREPPEGESFLAESTSTVLRPLTDEELKSMLAHAGFRTVELFGGYDRSPYVPLESPDVIALAL